MHGAMMRWPACRWLRSSHIYIVSTVLSGEMSTEIAEDGMEETFETLRPRVRLP